VRKKHGKERIVERQMRKGRKEGGQKEKRCKKI
jgi:hypothetical protein